MADDPGDRSDVARRALRRAGVHFLRAAIEVVQGVNAAIEELQRARRAPESGDDGKRHRIDLE